MNKDNNQRFRDTEEKIINAYGTLARKKELDKITVSDICREAQIHRTTFYGHFLDIRDLRECASRNQFRRLIESVSRTDGPNYREMILQELLFCYRHRKIIRKSLESGNISTSFFLPSVAETGAALSESEQAASLGGKERNRKAELEYYETFVQAGFMAILRKWILGGCPETPEELTDLVCKLYRFGE